MRCLFVTADERHAFAMHRPEQLDDPRILIFSRNTKSEPFGPAAVVSVGGDTRFAQFPRYVEATAELFVMRPGQPGIVVIRNFYFGTSTIPLTADETDRDASRKDLDLLQGIWLTIREETNGNVMSKDNMKQVKPADHH